MTPRLCRLCKVVHDPLLGCRQAARIASNGTPVASNGASNKVVNASNVSEGLQSSESREMSVGGVGERPKAVRRGDEGIRQAVAGPMPEALAGTGAKQRWSRQAYNAYQREYMKKRRMTQDSAPEKSRTRYDVLQADSMTQAVSGEPGFRVITAAGCDVTRPPSKNAAGAPDVL